MNADTGGARLVPVPDPKEPDRAPDLDAMPDSEFPDARGARSHDDGGDVDASACRSSDGACSPRPLAPPLGRLWDYLETGTPYQVPIPVCFTERPHREWDGRLRCAAQAAGTDCSGEEFTGTGQIELRRSLLTLLGETWMRATNVIFRPESVCEISSADGHDTRALPGRLVVTFVGGDADGGALSVTGIGEHDAHATDVHVEWKGLRDRDPGAIRRILREFGRALGMPYEWIRRQGAPSPCPVDLVPDPYLSWQTPPWGLYDDDSVMDRCSAGSATSTEISAGDSIAIQRLYGLKFDGAFVGHQGRCLNVEGAYPEEGTPLIAYPCAGALNDAWVPDSSSHSGFEARFRGVFRCPAVSEPLLPSGTPVVSGSCGTGDRWTMSKTDLEWRAMGKMCLEASSGYILTDTCDGTPEQRWDFWDTDPATAATVQHVRSAQTGLCVATATRDGASGQVLGLKECSSADESQLFVSHGAWIRHMRSGLCINVLGGGAPLSGKPIGLYACGPADASYYNNVFYVSGQIKMMGQCLTILPMERIGLEPCSSGAPSQRWDFHFKSTTPLF